MGRPDPPGRGRDAGGGRRAGARPAAIRAALDAELAELDAALAAAPTAAGQVQRGRILRDLGQLDASLAACQAAIALDPALADAHRGAGLTLARMGRDVDAIAAWEAAAAADPADVDALYNAGQAHYNRKAYADALRCWQRALERDARDFGLVKKVIQAQHALGHHDDAASTTELLRELWRTSTSAAVRLADEAIVDQFEVADVPVMVALTLRPPDPRSYAIYAFRAPATAKTPAVCVRIETSDYARERGVPFVLSVQRGRDYKALGTSEHLPAYPDLRTTAIRLITEAFGKPDPVAS
ncbi:MAG: tetratricopeptide repeat protein [Kofleriaceae bacterium]|nr:tetratricopeptide repeat protein [Kofleriaceae bacterium]